eukprot:CAMPEP_0119476576 /NCGR_PEP_ID=MMETSP1344-20130328/7038_1 /TAXON_ID=236787 /ORGANISM="Florenciella parvula, Strain CCMP2471" /LENGTH=33 /DNA_ID= /DNA_START= /DNA_END= /DNA_ORIENTATION=
MRHTSAQDEQARTARCNRRVPVSGPSEPLKSLM